MIDRFSAEYVELFTFIIRLNINIYRNRIPSFSAQNIDGQSAERPFANSLTITRNDFSNYQHMDADEIEIAYGLWWAAKVTGDGNSVSYTLDDAYDHSKIKGGAFLLGEFGVGVDFERYCTFSI